MEDGAEVSMMRLIDESVLGGYGEAWSKVWTWWDQAGLEEDTAGVLLECLLWSVCRSLSIGDDRGEETNGLHRRKLFERLGEDCGLR